ncbi:hypothetical protein LCGC14_0658460 [marine sediment metagenome]|uniref:Uncharacterized protein n=1 Tax=marine sediment metagenome TaxID=412755 RepID=A0A0F9U2L5_9ZZZZ
MIHSNKCPFKHIRLEELSTKHKRNIIKLIRTELTTRKNVKNVSKLEKKKNKC